MNTVLDKVEKGNIFTRVEKGALLNVLLNFQLLLAAIAAMIAFLAFHLTAATTSHTFFSLPHLLAFLVLSLILIYASFELYSQVKRCWRDQRAITGLCVSAFLGCFLLSFTSLAVTTFSTQNTITSMMKVALCILSLVGFLVFLVRYPTTEAEPVTEPVAPQNPSLALPVPVALQLPIVTRDEPVRPSPEANTPSIIPPRPDVQASLENLLSFSPQPRHTRFFTVAKDNEPVTRNEDACVISPDETCFALCDGVSNSQLPRGWAILLGRHWCQQPNLIYPDKRGMEADKLQAWLDEPRILWMQWVQFVWRAEANQRNRSRRQALVSDETIEKILAKGAFSTFLGLQIDRRADTMFWRALALGDTCLFLVKDASTPSPRLVPLLPLTNSQEFNRQPPTLSSNIDQDVRYLLPHFKDGQQAYVQGDKLLMATDALAQWLMFQTEQGLLEWQTLLNPGIDADSFARFILERQGSKANQMQKDDTTLVIIPL